VFVNVGDADWEIIPVNILPGSFGANASNMDAFYLKMLMKRIDTLVENKYGMRANVEFHIYSDLSGNCEIRERVYGEDISIHWVDWDSGDTFSYMFIALRKLIGEI
jgi:hypothetical protein